MKNTFRKSSQRRGNQLVENRKNRHNTGSVLEVRAGSKRGGKKLRRFSPMQMGLFKVAVVIVCCVLGFVGIRAAMQKLIDDPKFTVQVIDFETDGVINRETILKDAGVTEGMKIMKLDLEGIRNHLASIPEIKHVQIERDLPNRLAITVMEREPVAWLSCSSANVRARTQSYPKSGVRGLLVDESGVIMECTNLLPQYVQLPVIHVRELGQEKAGKTAEPEQILTALQLLQITRKMLFEESLFIKEMKLVNEYSIIAGFNSGTEAIFGVDDLEEQVSNFKNVYAKASKKNEGINTINLLVKRNIPVTNTIRKTEIDDIELPELDSFQSEDAPRVRRTIRKSVSRAEIMHPQSQETDDNLDPQ